MGTDRDWRSISEDNPAPSPAPAPVPVKPASVRRTAKPEPKPKTVRRPAPGSIEDLKARRMKMYALAGGLSGLAVLLLVVFVVKSTSGGTPPPPPEPPTVVRKPLPAPRSTPLKAVAGPQATADRMKTLAEREKASPKEYKTHYEGWAELRKEAPQEFQDEIREQMDRIQAAAVKEYRVLYHDVHEKVRDLLGAHEAREAQKVLQAWRIPAQLDVAGDLAADVRKELAAIAALITYGDLRVKLYSQYRADNFAADAAAELAPYLESSDVAVRVEAEGALAELKLIRVLGTLKGKLAGRRGAAVARIEDVKREIGVEAIADGQRLSRWEARIKDRTKKKPIPIAQLGVKDMNLALTVTKFDLRTVAFAGENIELTLSVDDLPGELLARLLTDAVDPANLPDALEAGKFLVRRNDFATARTMFALVRKDPDLADVIPDLDRLGGGGLGTLRAKTTLKGDTLTIAYDFQAGEQHKDFKPSVSCKVEPGSGSLTLNGERLFYAYPGELKFDRRLRIAAEPGYIGGSAGYILGAGSEGVPGELDLIIVLVQPDRGYRVVKIKPKGEQQVLGEGALNASGGAIELAFDGTKAEFRAGGVTAWTGAMDFGSLTPVIGGAGFQEGQVSVSYKSVKFEGRATPEWIRRLQSERLTVIESELSKERRATKEERRAKGFAAGRSFGDGMEKPLPLEGEVGELMPPKVAKLYAAARALIKKLETAKTDQQVWKLSGQVRQCLEESVQEAPWFPLTYFYRAEWRFEEGDASGAIRDLADAVSKQGAFVEARVALADLYLRESKYAEAGRELDAALDAVPDLARARLTRALLHYYAGKDAEAISELELARRLEPGDTFLRRSAKRLRNVVSGPRWAGIVTLETPHYTVRAEAPKLGKASKKDDSEKIAKERTQKYADYLNGSRSLFEQLVPGKEARSRKPVVYICDTPESYYTYADFTSEDRLEHTAGVYLGQYQQLLFYRAETEEETLHVMTHEGFHEYLHAVAPAAPIWLNEGMAEYAAGVRTAGGRVGELDRMLKGRLRTLQSAFDYGWEGWEFDIVFHESREQFYTISPELQYAQAWSMVHFLMHAKGGKYKPLLDQYIKVLIDSNSAVQAAHVIFKDKDLAGMQREWLSYVKALR